MDFAGLFTCLRSDPRGDTANEIGEQITRGLMAADSIVALFSVAESTDPVIRGYALFAINKYLVMHKNSLDVNNVRATQERCLSLLTNETSESVQNSISKIIEYLFNEFSTDWSLFFTWFYSGMANVTCGLEIMAGTDIQVISRELGANRLFYGTMFRDVLSGTQPRAFCAVMTIMFRLMAQEKSRDMFAEYHDLILGIYVNTLRSGNLTLFNTVLGAINIGIDAGVGFLDTNRAMAPTFMAVQDARLSLEFRESVNSAVLAFLMTANDLPTAKLGTVFECQMRVLVSLFPLNDDDENMLWVTDSENIIAFWYGRMPERAIIERVQRMIGGIMNATSVENRFAALVAAATGILFASEAFDQETVTRFLQILLALLADENQSIALMTCQYLIRISKKFPEIVTACITAIVPVVMNFIGVSGVYGTELLASLMEALTTSDGIIVEILPILLRMTHGGDVIAVGNVISTIKWLVTRSTVCLPSVVAPIYARAMETLHGPEPEKYIEMFGVLQALCKGAIEEMKGHVEELFKLVITVMGSSDITISYWGIDTVPALLKILQGQPDGRWVGILFEALSTLCKRTIEGSMEDVMVVRAHLSSGRAVSSLACLVADGQMIPALPSVLMDILRVASLGSWISMYLAGRSFACLKDMLGSASSFKEVAEPAIGVMSFLVAALDPDATIAGYEPFMFRDFLLCVAQVISVCGVAILGGAISRLVEYLPSIVNRLLKDADGVVKDGHMFPVFFIVSVLTDSSSPVAGLVVEVMFRVLSGLVHQQQPFMESFVIDMFTIMISKADRRAMMSPEFKTNVTGFALERVSAANLCVACSAAKFCAAIALHNVPLEELGVSDGSAIRTALVNRLRSLDRETSFDYNLKEAVIYALAALAHNSSDAFPSVEILQLIVPDLPVRRDYSVADTIYRFMSSVFHCTDVLLKEQYIRIFSCVFAQSDGQIDTQKIDVITKASMITLLEKCLANYTEVDQLRIVGASLGGNQRSMADFWAMWPARIAWARMTVGPTEADLEAATEITQIGD